MTDDSFHEKLNKLTEEVLFLKLKIDELERKLEDTTAKKDSSFASQIDYEKKRLFRNLDEDGTFASTLKQDPIFNFGAFGGDVLFKQNSDRDKWVFGSPTPPDGRRENFVNERYIARPQHPSFF